MAANVEHTEASRRVSNSLSSRSANFQAMHTEYLSMSGPNSRACPAYYRSENDSALDAENSRGRMEPGTSKAGNGILM